MPKTVLCYDDYFSRYGKLNTFRCPLPGFSLTIVLLFLRWLKTVPSTFEDLEFDYHHSISVDVKILATKTCPIIGEQVVVNFVAQ